jgi:nucleolar protein 14
MHKNFKRGLSHGALDPEAKTWPGLAELSLLRVVGIVWPTSDMNHPVISPARLLMGAYLGLGRVRSLIDIGSGLFLCTLFLQYEELSKRLVPETINFLVNAVLHLCPHQFKDISSLPGSFPSPDFRSDLCKSLTLKSKKGTDFAVRKVNLADILDGGDLNEQTKVDLLGLTFNLLGRFGDMYKGLEGFIELFQPINDIVSKLDTRKLSTELQVSRTVRPCLAYTSPLFT